MKNKFLLATAMLVSGSACAQWPVSHGSQGTVTGTIGEVRGSGGRIHNGTDIVGNSTTVYSIQDDQIFQINTVNSSGQSLGTSKNIVMASGITYFHVTVLPSIAANALQIQQINNGSVVVTLAQGQAFAQMVVQGGWPTHVHVVNGTNENFLANGFGSSGFAFVDNVLPQYGLANNVDSVKFFKDLVGQAWLAPTSFDQRVTDEGLPVKEQPLILWGPIDIVANVYQQRINATGGAAGGYLAPKYLGYRIINSTTSAVVYDDFETVKFDFGFGGGTVDASSQQVFRRIHSKKSTSSNPYFIVSNPFSSGVSTDGNFATAQYPDGDYIVTVRATGATGTGASASNLIANKVCKVRLDNYKTYVKQVQVADAGSGVIKYEAEWSGLTIPGDGSITLEKRNNEPFKNGSEAMIIATTSERVPSLTLLVPGGPNVTLTAVAGTDGKEWTGNFMIPNTASNKMPLTFKSGDKFYGLALNQITADVKRQANGLYLTAQSSDKSHELNVCPADAPLMLEVNVQDGQDVMLFADGGTMPYQYSMDLMPVPANHQSNFGSDNTFTIEFDKQYLFKVKDAGECIAEIYYTLPKVPCDALVNSGGVGTDIKQVNLGNTAGTVDVHYEMFSIPDQITLTYKGISQTTGIVSGSGVLSVQHLPEAGQSNLLTITMVAPDPDTGWEYYVVCPNSERLALDMESEGLVPAMLSYSENRVTVLTPLGGENELYRLRYRLVGSSEWTEIYGVRLPHQLDRKRGELEVKVAKDASAVSNSLSVYPNPAQSNVEIVYQSEKDGIAEISVHNQYGQQVMFTKLTVRSGINLVTWAPEGPSGLMLIKVAQDGTELTTKLVIEK